MMAPSSLKCLARALVQAGLLTVVLAAQCLRSNGQETPTAPPQVIKRIVIRAPKVINRSALLSQSGLHVGDPLLPGTLREARRRIWDVGGFDNRDPGDALVVRAEGKSHDATIFIEIERNSVLERVTVKGSGPMAAREIIRAFGIRRGTTLTNQLLRDRFQRINEHYGRKGYVGVVSDYGCTDGVLELEITVSRVSEVSFGKVPAGQIHMAQLANRPGGYYRPKALKNDAEVLKKSGWIVEAEPRIKNNSNSPDFEVEWHVSRPMSEDETAVLNTALEEWIEPRRERIILSREGLGNYLPVNPLIRIGDMEPIVAEFRKAAAAPGFMIEIQFTNWSNALNRAYPGYSEYIWEARPICIGPDTARIKFHVGPPDSVHGGRQVEYHLKKVAGKWAIETTSYS